MEWRPNIDTINCDVQKTSLIFKNLKNNLPLLVALDTFDDARELALVEGTGEAKAASK